MNVDVQSLAAEVDKALDNIARSYGSNYGGGLQIYITMRVKRLFEVAAEEADRLGDNYISTEHLFLAVAAEHTGPSARLLQQFGVDNDKIYAALKEVHGDEPVPASEHRTTRWASSVRVPRGDATNAEPVNDRIRAQFHELMQPLEQEVASLREQMQSLEGKIDQLLELAKGEHDDQP